MNFQIFLLFFFLKIKNEKHKRNLFHSNNLRFHSRREQQAKYRKMSKQDYERMVEENEEIHDQGEPMILPKCVAKSKRWYNKLNQDCMFFFV